MKNENANMMMRQGTTFDMEGYYNVAAELYEKAFMINPDYDIFCAWTSALRNQMEKVEGTDNKVTVLEQLCKAFDQGIQRNIIKPQDLKLELRALEIWGHPEYGSITVEGNNGQGFNLKDKITQTIYNPGQN